MRNDILQYNIVPVFWYIKFLLKHIKDLHEINNNNSKLKNMSKFNNF
jgi:hypothetical protein